MTVTGTHFLGMFQSLSETEKIKVTLSSYENGVFAGNASGTDSFNFVHGQPKWIAYGTSIQLNPPLQPTDH